MLERNEILDSVVTSLWLKNSILAALTHKVGLEIVDNKDIPACAYTNGRGLYINWAECQKFGDEIKKQNYVFLAVHELMHILTLTHERRGNRDPKIWNWATDYEINDMIINNKSSTGQSIPIGEMLYAESLKSPDNPKGQAWLYEEKYHNWSAEDIYDDLIEQFKNANNGMTPDEFRKKMAQQLGQALKDAMDNGQPDAVEKWLKEHSKGRGEPIDLDDMLDGMSEEDKQRVKVQVQDTLQKLSTGSSKCGSMLQRAFEFLLKEPPFDWRGFLVNYLKNFIRSDFTWRRPHRRSNALGTILPGSNVEAQIKLGIAIDTSGSICGDEVNEFLAHIQKIMKSFRGFEIDVWCFSTQVHEETLRHYTQHNRDMSSFELASNGGTDIASNFRWIEDKGKRYDVFICMTDGYDSITDLVFRHCPTIWAITHNEDFHNPVGVVGAKVMRVEF